MAPFTRFDRFIAQLSLVGSLLSDFGQLADQLFDISETGSWILVARSGTSGQFSWSGVVFFRF